MENRREGRRGTALGCERKIRRTERVIAGAELLLLTAFLCFCAWGDVPVLIVGTVYGILALAIGSLGYVHIRCLINEVMRRVDDTILGLIGGEKVISFSEKEDDLLGKFQNQIGRLYDILTANEAREKELREELSGLVADLVHQINTPLTNISLYVSFLEDPSLDEDTRKRFLDRINGQVEKMKWFGNGFDKVARLETDIIHLQPKEQPLLPILLGAIDQAALKAEAAGLEISLEGDRELTVWCDRKWTEEAIFNLLDNAVKYAVRKGRIRVNVTAYDLFARVDVEDVSQTIGETEYNHVFQRFYRGSSAAMVTEGVGLGLYLTRQIIDGQSGYLQLAPGKDGGNVFSVFLKQMKEGISLEKN
ncbi:MAG: sensor histidine kinase [Blautia sp.]|jgi:signal transduction histidine kinase